MKIFNPTVALSLSLALSAAAIAPVYGATPTFSSPGISQESQSEVESDPELAKKTKELAYLIAPLDLTISANKDSALVGIQQAAANDPSVKIMLDSFPGIDVAMVEPILPLIETEVTQRHPNLIESISGLYAQHLNLAELDELITYFSGDVGRKVVRGGFAQSSEVEYNFATDGQDNFTGIEEESLRAQLPQLSANIFGSLTAEEKQKALAFGLSPTGRKFAALEPEVLNLSLKWSNAFAVELEPTTTPIMVAAAQEYVTNFTPEN